MSDTNCADCGAKFVAYGCTTGYGEDKTGARHCFACCGKNDERDIKAAAVGRFNGVAFYATKEGTRDEVGCSAVVANWPGTLKTRGTYGRWARGGFGTKRRQVRFVVAGRMLVGTEYNGVCSGNLLRGVRIVRAF